MSQVRTLITGGAGFLGSHLCDYLIEKGHSIICLDNLVTGSEKNIAHLLNNKNFTFIKQDVSNYIDISSPIDYVIHFASPASPIDYMGLKIPTLKAGSLGTHNTLGVAKAKGASYLLASTSEVYGDPLEHPQKETYWGNVNPVGPRAVYDEAKRFAEALTMAYHNTHNIKTHIVRIFNTYGSRMRINDGRILPTIIPQAIKGDNLTIFGDGSQTRSFCYVSDLIAGIYEILLSGEPNPINLGGTDEVTILQLAKEVVEFTNSKSKIKFLALPQDDPKVRRPDISKAKKLLGWEPKVSRKEGLRLTLEYFKKVLS